MHVFFGSHCHGTMFHHLSKEPSQSTANWKLWVWKWTPLDLERGPKISSRNSVGLCRDGAGMDVHGRFAAQFHVNAWAMTVHCAWCAFNAVDFPMATNTAVGICFNLDMSSLSSPAGWLPLNLEEFFNIIDWINCCSSGDHIFIQFEYINWTDCYKLVCLTVIQIGLY